MLATLWARTRIEQLMSEDWNGAQHSQMRGGLRESITQLALQFRLMTQFTSFVAVEESTVTTGGVPTKVEVPVEFPRDMKDAPFIACALASDVDFSSPATATLPRRVKSDGRKSFLSGNLMNWFAGR